MSQKIGFWSVLALVTGSQIGSGIFMLPSTLANFGGFSFIGWIISGIAAITLALVFSKLCAMFPKTGGPHAYVKEAYGLEYAFFTGWTYWVISWVSSTAVIITAISYLTPLIGNYSGLEMLGLQILLLVTICYLNLKGIKNAGRVEFFLSALKILPLFIIPIIGLFSFNSENIAIAENVKSLPLSKILSQVTLLTLWGFIGVESATTPAESVANPAKTIPRAITIGTILVASLYLINSVAIQGIMPASELAASKAPYADASRIMFGGNFHLALSLIAAIICIGTFNAWTLTTAQIPLGLAKDNLMPNAFTKLNKNDAPYISIIISGVGIATFLVLTSSENFAKQMNLIIDFSVTGFLYVYLACCLSLLKILRAKKISLWKNFYIFISILFCALIIYETPISTLLIAGLFTLSGVPVYYLNVKKKIKILAH